MSVTPLSLFQSLSVVAVILSGTAIFISQKEDQPEFTGTSAVGAVDTSVLEETISQLRGDLLTMQMRLDLLEQPPSSYETLRGLQGGP